MKKVDKTSFVELLVLDCNLLNLVQTIIFTLCYSTYCRYTQSLISVLFDKHIKGITDYICKYYTSLALHIQNRIYVEHKITQVLRPGPVFTKNLILRISLILRIFLKIVVFLRKILRIRIFLFTKILILRITLILRIFLRMVFILRKKKEFAFHTTLILRIDQRLAYSMLNLRKIVVLVNIVQQLIANRHPEQSVTY